MKASELLIKKIKEFEGLRLAAYKPIKTERYYTIGYGHSAADVTARMRITESKAEELLKRDLFYIERYVNSLGVAKTQGQFDALVDFCYNLGKGRLETSTLLRLIKSGKPTKQIQNEICKWVYAGGKKQLGLVKRRLWEAKRYAE